MSYSEVERGPMAADVLGMHFVQIANQVFRDPRTSGKAKGIFGNIATHRRGYKLSPERIAQDMTDGVNSIKTGLRELERCGYLQRTRERHPDGTLRAAQYWITDIPQAGSVVEDTTPETDANGHQPSAQPANENHPLDVPSGYTHRPSAQPTNDLPTLDEPTVADRPPKNTNSPNTNSPNPERAREHDPTPAVTTGSETDAETDTQSEASGAAPVAEPETDGDESDTAGQARRLAANVDWAAEVGAWKSQYGEIRAAVAAALNRGVPPAMLGAYLPTLASQARTVHYVLTGLSPDRLPTGATPASLGLASDGNTGRAPACPTHPDALPRTRYDGTRRCPHCHPPTQQPPNTPTYVHDLLTALRTKKDWHDPTTDRQAEATGTHSGPQPALTRSPGGRQPGESIDDYRARISEQLWQLDHDTRDAGSAGEPKAAA